MEINCKEYSVCAECILKVWVLYECMQVLSTSCYEYWVHPSTSNWVQEYIGSQPWLPVGCNASLILMTGSTLYLKEVLHKNMGSILKLELKQWTR